MRLKVVGIVFALAAFVAPAHAGNWSIGANLGVSFVSPDGGDMVTVIGWPSGSGVIPIAASPGLRVGFVGANPEHEFYVDTGLQIITGSGSTLRSAQITGNYQYNFTSSGSTAPYLTGGIGILSFGESDGASEGAVSPVFGGGVGVRHKMGNGNGTLRAEARFDHTNEGKDSGDVLFPAQNTFTIKLGFDLWGK